MLAKNPLGERFPVPDLDIERTRFMGAGEFLKVFREGESEPQKPPMEGETAAYSRSARARKEAEKAIFEIEVWAKIRRFARENGLPDSVEAIDRMCYWKNYSWAQPFNVFAIGGRLCSLTDREKCLVTEGYRPTSKNLEDALEKAGVAFKEEFEASVATTRFEVAYSGDPTVAADNTLVAKRVFNGRLEQVALIVRGL